MMRKIDLGEWKIEVDREATRTAYQKMSPLDAPGGCPCNICRNYTPAVEEFPAEVKAFMNGLGVDVAKPMEIMDSMAGKNGKVHYGGWYVLTGNLLEGEDFWNTEKVDEQGQPQRVCKEIAEGFEVAFTRETRLFNECFSPPYLQMEIFFQVPWVLPEAYTMGGLILD